MPIKMEFMACFRFSNTLKLWYINTLAASGPPKTVATDMAFCENSFA